MYGKTCLDTPTKPQPPKVVEAPPVEEVEDVVCQFLFFKIISKK